MSILTNNLLWFKYYYGYDIKSFIKCLCLCLNVLQTILFSFIDLFFSTSDTSFLLGTKH